MNTTDVKKNEEISRLISKMFDSRMEFALLSYIMEKGSEVVKDISDDEISKIEGNGFARAEFNQALVRTARELCRKFTLIELMTYIRCDANFAPYPKPITFYRDEYDEENWEYLCDRLDVNEEQENITILAIANE